MTSETTNTQTSSPPLRKRGCLYQLGRALLILLLIVVALIVLGVVYQDVATEQDKSAYTPRGELHQVNGHQMHIVCKGEGTPTVVLEAGGAAESLWWYHVQNQLAQHTRVCAYDRPGHGWSEPTTAPRDAVTMVDELYTLLAEAGEQPPFVMAGHSYGALWARIFAHHYPDDVVGLAQIDSSFLFPHDFTSQAEFEQWKSSNDAIQAIPWALYRTGLMRLTSPGGFQAAGYPSEIVSELAALQSPNHVFDADFAEQIAARLPLTEASAAAENLGDLPLMILWAGESPSMQPVFADRRAALEAASSNSATRIIAGADHVSLLGNEQHAQQVADAILALIESVRSGETLSQ